MADTRGMALAGVFNCVSGQAATLPMFGAKHYGDAISLSFESVGAGVTNGFIQYSNDIDENNPDIAAAAAAATWKGVWRGAGLLEVSTPPNQTVVYDANPSFACKAIRVASGDDFAPTTFPSTFIIRVWKQFKLGS